MQVLSLPVSKQLALLCILSSANLVLTSSTTSSSISKQQPGPQQNIRARALQVERKPRGDEPNVKENEIPEEEPAYLLPEPVKSLAQTATRYALAQTTLPDHVSIDGAMSILNDAAYQIAKPSVFTKLLKIASVMIASSMGAAFFMPDVFDSIWNQPSRLWNLDNLIDGSISESRVMYLANSTSEHVFNSVGLEAKVCRERSICYLGEILHCLMPRTSEGIIKFGRKNLSSSSDAFRSHPLGRAFLLGFVDRNCSSIQHKPPSADDSYDIASRSLNEHNGSCLRTFLTTLIGPSTSTSSRNNKGN